MKSDLKIALRIRWVQITLLFSLLLRAVFFAYILPRTPSEYGPDEGTYGFLAGYVANESPVESFPSFGPALYNSSRSFIVPSSLLVRIGLGDLEAVRAISSLYGILSSLFVVLCLVAILQARASKSSLEDYGARLSLPVVIFTFLPSNFLWSILGLRESSSQFWLIASFYFLLKLYFVTGRTQIIYFFSVSLSLTLAFGARKETALVAAISALIAGIVIAIKRRIYTFIGAVVLGILGGQMFTAIPQVTTKEVFYLYRESGTTANLIIAPVGVCKSNKQTVKLKDGTFTCVTVIEQQTKVTNPIESTKRQLAAITKLEEKRSVLAVGAKSALAKSNCLAHRSELQTALTCSLKELPYRLPTFLFRPIPLIDSGSFFLNIAGLENVFWMMLIMVTFYLITLVRTTHQERLVPLGLSFYIVSFSVLASLYEGNLGTAFRHKSSILWPLVLVLAILLCQKKMNLILKE